MGRLPRSVGLPSSPPLSPILRREEQRLSLVSGLEDWLHELHGMGRFGREDLDVHTCALRVVCEVAMVRKMLIKHPVSCSVANQMSIVQVPNSEGLIGELLHLLLTPKDVLLKLPPAYRSNEYIQAQVDGGVHGDCANYQRRCPVSFFQVRRSLRKSCSGSGFNKVGLSLSDVGRLQRRPVARGVFENVRQPEKQQQQ